MAKQKAYYWRGPGELLGCKPGEKVPTEKMDKDQLAKMIKDGRIQETAFDIAEDAGVVADLKKQVKKLSAQIVDMNKAAESNTCEKCAELEAQAALDAEKIADLEGLIESATDDKKD